MSETPHTERKGYGTFGRIFVWLWYLPVIVVLAMGTLLTFDQKTSVGIVDKARVFQDSEEASKPLEPLGTHPYKLSVALDQKFSLTGKGFETSGDFRAGDELEFPVTLTSPGDRSATSVRAQVLTAKDKGVLPGLTVQVRSCETPWKEVAGALQCAGPNRIEVSTSDLTVDTFSVMDEEEKLAPGEKKYLLFKLAVKPDIIIPVEGYRESIKVVITGLTEPVKG